MTLQCPGCIQSNMLSNHLCALLSNSCLGDCSALNQYPVNFRPHSDPSTVAPTHRPLLWRKAVNEQNACWSCEKRSDHWTNPMALSTQWTGLCKFFLLLLKKCSIPEFGMSHTRPDFGEALKGLHLRASNKYETTNYTIFWRNLCDMSIFLIKHFCQNLVNKKCCDVLLWLPVTFSVFSWVHTWQTLNEVGLFWYR